ncbi:DsrE family protein [Alicyclobacillus curvatus]|nr:DsrE family protein [Alicyclobacillus curvatus]
MGIMVMNEKILLSMKLDNSLAPSDTVWRVFPMKFLFILNDPPYGTERSYNGFRHVNTLSKREDVEVKVFLMADAVLCAKKGQKTADGYYNLEKMILVSSRRGVELGACGTCLDARGLNQSEIAESVHRSTMEELTDWTLWADKVIVY